MRKIFTIITLALCCCSAFGSEPAHLVRAKSAAVGIPAGSVPALYLVIVQDSGTDLPYAGAVASFPMRGENASLAKTFEQGKTKWTLTAEARRRNDVLSFNGRFDGWIDLGSFRMIGKNGVAGGIGSAGDIKATLRKGEPWLITSQELRSDSSKDGYTESLSLFLLWK